MCVDQISVWDRMRWREKTLHSIVSQLMEDLQLVSRAPRSNISLEARQRIEAFVAWLSMLNLAFLSDFQDAIFLGLEIVIASEKKRYARIEELSERLPYFRRTWDEES